MHILPQRFGEIEAQIPDIHAGLGNDLQVGIFCGQGNVSRIGELADVDVSGLEFQKTHRVFRDGAEHHFVQPGPPGFVPVFIKSFQHNLIILDPFDKFEGAGSHRIADEFLGIFHKGSGTDNIRKIHAHIGQKGGIHPVESENCGMFVNCLNGSHRFVHLHLQPVLRRTFLNRKFHIRIEKFHFGFLHHAANGKDHSIRVEKRSVMEFHSLAQMKGVGHSVRCNVPGFSQPGLQDCGFIRIFHQSLQNIVTNHKGIAVCFIGRIQSHTVSASAKHQSSSFFWCFRGHCHSRCQESKKTKPYANFLPHFLLLSLFPHLRQTPTLPGFPDICLCKGIFKR